MFVLEPCGASLEDAESKCYESTKNNKSLLILEVCIMCLQLVKGVSKSD